jgi:hypothetical protein
MLYIYMYPVLVCHGSCECTGYLWYIYLCIICTQKKVHTYIMIYSHHLFARIQAKESWKFINSPVPVWLGKIISSSSNKLGIERRVTIIFENLLADCFLGIVHFSCPYLGFVRKWSAPSSNELSPFSPISRFNMYICIYVYIYICIYVYMYMYIYIYTYL